MDGKLLPWLYGIATNVLRNRRRAQWRHRRLVAQLEAQPRRAAEPDADARAQAAVQMREVLEHLGRLPRAQREVLALCVWSGLSYEEAALALAIPVGTVRSRLARARATLTEPQGHSRHKEVEMELKGIAEK